MDERQTPAPEANGAYKSKMDASMALAIIAVLFGFLNVSFDSSTGFGFGIGIIGALTMGAGAAYTIFAVIWDILFIGAPVLVLIGISMRDKDSVLTRRLIIGALCLCIGIIVLDIVFAMMVRSAGLQSFSLIEMMIIASYGSDVNLTTQFVIYVGALVVVLVALKMRNSKVAIIGLAVVAVIALGTLVCGLQPFAYSVGGITIFGQTLPLVTTYYISEFLTMICMWASIALFMMKFMPKEAKSDEEN